MGHRMGVVVVDRIISTSSSSSNITRRLLSLAIIVLSVARAAVGHSDALYDQDDGYPLHIPTFRVRRDVYTGEPVSRGRLSAWSDLFSLESGRGANKIALGEFKQRLQCAPSQPIFREKLASLLSPTREIAELVAAFIESECRPWLKCREVLAEYKKGKYPSTLGNRNTQNGAYFQGARMIRVMNGSLYYDWPWGVSRFTPNTIHLLPLLFVLDLVYDVKDSVFIHGEETSVLPWDIAFPSFGSSPSFETVDIPSIWTRTFATEMQLVKRYGNRQPSEFDDAAYHELYTKHSEWSLKIPKASHFGNMGRIRQVLYDVATLRPDLIEAKWTYPYMFLTPWNPASREVMLPSNVIRESETDATVPIPQPTHGNATIGFISNVIGARIREAVDMRAGQFKYLVVLLGLNEGYATSDRLAALLAHSGAVILLQESSFSYHFSSFLKPWVHYVPLAYSLADVASKVEWLQRNDKLAKRIASNARNFGRSYLRLEDHLCYAAAQLEFVGKLAEGTDAAQGFSPVKIEYSGRYFE